MTQEGLSSVNVTSLALFLNAVHCTDQQIHNFYLSNVLSFDPSASSSGTLNLVLCWSYKIIKITTQ